MQLLPLTRYSLISRDASARTYSIHRLVQAVIRDRMGKEAQSLWAERTVRAVNSAFPNVEFSNWHLCGRLIPHAMACAGSIRYWGFEFVEAARLLNNAGYCQYERPLYAEAEPLYKRALEIFEKSLGEKHPTTVTVSENLAALLREMRG